MRRPAAASLLLLALPVAHGLSVARAAPRKAVTDVIHRTIDLHPLCVAIIDTPEYQRLRGVSQLASCKWVFPCAVHDRFQHSIGVAHLAKSWADHFRLTQPVLGIDDSDVLCVTLAGLCHDLGHGPLSHLWEGQFLAAAKSADPSMKPPCHEDLSCAILDLLLARNEIDISPWLLPEDIEFVKALIRGSPSPFTDGDAMRLGSKGVPGSDKSFLYEIVANQRSGFDVDKLDYFERDCAFAGTVKVSFDRSRLMAQARVAALDQGSDADDKGTDAERSSGSALHICWPVKCVFEVMQVFITRFSLHYELYQHRVVSAIGLMLRDALVLADRSQSFRVYGGPQGTAALRLCECGGARDPGLAGYLQLEDGILSVIVAEARRQQGVAGASSDGGRVDDDLQAAAALLRRIERRDLYRFAGSVTFEEGVQVPSMDSVANDLVALSRGALDADQLRVDLRRVHCGQGPRNPLERIWFFDNKGASASETRDSLGAIGVDAQLAVPTAFRHPSASYAARLPSAFEERSLRVFVTDDAALGAAQDALAQWCDERSLCSVDGLCFIGNSVPESEVQTVSVTRD